MYIVPLVGALTPLLAFWRNTNYHFSLQIYEVYCTVLTRKYAHYNCTLVWLWSLVGREVVLLNGAGSSNICSPFLKLSPSPQFYSQCNKENDKVGWWLSLSYSIFTADESSTSVSSTAIITMSIASRETLCPTLKLTVLWSLISNNSLHLDLCWFGSVLVSVFFSKLTYKTSSVFLGDLRSC